MGQDEIVINLEHDQGLGQPGFTFTRGGTAPPDRRYSQAQAQIQALDNRSTLLVDSGVVEFEHRVY